MITFTIWHSDIRNNTFIPKYYDPQIKDDVDRLRTTHDIYSIQEMIDQGIISVAVGDEIGKMAYGTGSIPFIRTSDITNWELKTIPKQGISEEIYNQYSVKQDVKVGDILMVRDGDYLIGSNCMITPSDLPLLYQSHILKFRVDEKRLNPYLFFIILNSQIVQRQIRNVQFTADIIDTIGSRYLEIQIPIPKDAQFCNSIVEKVKNVLESRDSGKLAIKQFPLIMEEILKSGNLNSLDEFFTQTYEQKVQNSTWFTARSEFGDTVSFWMKFSQINNQIFLPKYYNPELMAELQKLSEHCDLYSIQQLVDQGRLELQTGVEIGKLSYGSGEIPFVRTSDFTNWEMKTDPKQNISEDVYEEYAKKTDVRPGDVLLVRDGSYLIGTTCLVTENDSKMLYCGGIYKIRSLDNNINPYLLMALFNSFIVRQQIRTKQFTRDVIDTIGKRLLEVVIPIPKDRQICDSISTKVEEIIRKRIEDRDTILSLSKMVEEIRL